MRTSRFSLRTLALLALLLFSPAMMLTGCGDDSEDAPQVQPETKDSIGDIAATNSDFSTLQAALEAADLSDVLKGDGPFTVFAPNNAAFAKIPQAELEALLADKDRLTKVLQGHVVGDAVPAEDVVKTSGLNSLSGERIPVTNENGEVRVAGSLIIQTDVEASNGFIHIIDTVILPEAVEEPKTIPQVATEAGSFGTLITALETAGLVDTLNGPGPFTVLAPNDAAFAKVDSDALAALLDDVPALTDVLLTHVVDGEFRAETITGLDSVTTRSGVELDVVVDGANVTIGGAAVISTDIEASNGIIHVLGDVILEKEPGTILEVAAEAGSFNTLIAAVNAAGLDETLNGEGPFTVLAPNDSAIAGLGEGTVAALLEDIPRLTDILLAHVIEGEVLAAQVVGLESATSINGVELEIVVDGDNITIGGAPILATDIEASNGVIHVLGDVIVPPARIPGVAIENGSFTTLVTALDAAGLVEVLNGDGPFTVLAPNDDAFADLPEGTVAALLEDIPRLTDILLAHVIEGEFDSTQVAELDSVTTINGVELEVVNFDGTLAIGSAPIVTADVPAFNGIIHVLGAVIVPEPRIPGVAAEAGNFTTLIAALEAADLVDTLNGDGPFTVLAPDDDAFAGLPEGTVAGLLEDIPALTEILEAHVIEGEFSSEQIAELDSLTSISGVELPITDFDGTLAIGTAAVVTADVPAFNGVIHILGGVIIPEPEVVSIIETATENGSFTTLIAALEAADLVDTLNGEGPFTVLAPNNDAFAGLPDGTVPALLEDIPRLTDVLLAHVIEGEFSSAQVAELDTVTSINGVELEILELDDTLTIGGAPIIMPDVPTSNGVIHVLGDVIVPPARIPSVAIENGSFTTLVEALVAADLVDTLNGDGPFTVFAPNDLAFEGLPEGALADLLDDIPALTDLLLAHVVEGRVLAEEVVTLTSVVTINGVLLPITVEDEVVTIGNATVVATDVPAFNGVIHVLGDVIQPPGRIPAVATADPQFSTLVTALDAADLVDTLDGEGPFTVLAPNNGAFDNLPDGTVAALLEDIPRLTDILLAHVIEGVALSGDVAALDSVTSINGVELDIDVDGDTITIGGSPVIAPDIFTANGVIHVLGDVIVPPARIPGVAIENGSFTTLVEALVAADLVDTLNGDGPFTVLAPNDDAFADLPDGALAGLLNDIPALTDVLLTHVIAGEFSSEEVATLDTVTTESGAVLDVVVDGDTITIGGSTVISADVPAFNGVIHVIDTVIVLPDED